MIYLFHIIEENTYKMKNVHKNPTFIAINQSMLLLDQH